jgi:hypothetical protein
MGHRITAHENLRVYVPSCIHFVQWNYYRQATCRYAKIRSISGIVCEKNGIPELIGSKVWNSTLYIGE